MPSAATRSAGPPTITEAPEVVRRPSDYAELMRQVKQAGLLHRRRGYYLWKITLTAALLAAGWTAFVIVGNSWWQLVVAAVLAIVFGQIGFLGHDAGHRQGFTSKRANYVVAYLGAVLLVLPPGKAIAFVALQQALFGLYLGCSFAPNHKGMPILAADDRTDFLRRQVLTSRNVRGGWFVDLALGALNYQIEHHLFPNMPRPNLRRAQPVVRAFCPERGVPYVETTLLRSYAEAIRHLHRVGEPLRAAEA